MKNMGLILQIFNITDTCFQSNPTINPIITPPGLFGFGGFGGDEDESWDQLGGTFYTTP